MKISEYDGSKLRLILIGMITDTKVCSRISAIMDKPQGPRFEQKWADLIAKWCREHLDKYQAPPNGNIGIIFRKWADSSRADPKTINQIETLLEYMSDEYSGSVNGNADFVLDLASDYFNKHRLKSVVEEVEDQLTYGQVEEAYDRLGSTSRIELGYSNLIDPMQDVERWLEAASEERSKPLFEYPGAVGQLTGDSFTKGTLFAFQGVDKVGKSYYLLDAAFRALRRRHKVLYFEVGDLGPDETLIRLGQRINLESEFPDHVRWPTGWSAKHPEVPTYSNLTKYGTSVAHARKLLAKHTRGKSLLKISPHPNSSINVPQIEDIIQGLAIDGWMPDMVCIAEGSLVLTDRGLVPIEKVTSHDKVWDGSAWVNQKGPIYKGEREVIDYAGLTATPDHKVWTKGGWRTLESCKRLGLHIAQTGIDKQRIRLSENYFTRGPSTQKQNELRTSSLCLCTVCALQAREMDSIEELENRGGSRMSSMHAAKKVPNLAVWEIAGRAGTLSESKSQQLQALRSKRDKIQLFNCDRSMSLGVCQFGNPQGIGVRSDRERWSLRTRQSEMVHPRAELMPHSKAWEEGKNASVSSIVSEHHLCGRNSWEILCTGLESYRHSQPLESNQETVRKSRTWDLIGCGPFHRFTVQGLLVHNCIDYADILAPPPGRMEVNEQVDQTWKQLRRMTQRFNVLGLTATQSGAQAYRSKSSVLTKRDFQGRRTKFAEVNGMLGLNANDFDMQNGVTRLNWIVRRKGKWSVNRQVLVAGCLACAAPIVLSKWAEYGKKTESTDDEAGSEDKDE